MAANEYHLTTDWRFAGTIEEVFALLRDTGAMAR